MTKKKKAIEEKKAPLRELLDTPTNCNSYIVHDPDHELAMKVTDGSVDGVWLDGEELGGGGGGDFSTAEVTFIDTNEEGYSVYAPFVLEGDEYVAPGGLLPEGVTPASSIYSSYMTDTFTDPVKIALYKNSAYISIDGSIVSVSGNATILDPPGNSCIQITGDCTITVS